MKCIQNHPTVWTAKYPPQGHSPSIITVVQFHFPELLEVKFTSHMRLKVGIMSVPNNSDKNVNGGIR
jgi:hypothetical protein